MRYIHQDNVNVLRLDVTSENTIVSVIIGTNCVVTIVGTCPSIDVVEIVR